LCVPPLGAAGDDRHHAGEKPPTTSEATYTLSEETIMSEKKKPIRGRGEGSIRYREDLGCWTAQASFGTRADGKRRRLTVTAPTKEEVVKKLRKLHQDNDRGALADSGKLTVGDLLTHWLRVSRVGGMRNKTYENYDMIVRLYLRPHLGLARLGKLTSLHFEEMLIAMDEAGKSLRMRQFAFAALHRALAYATDQDPPLVGRNVCDAVARPKVPRKEAPAFDPDQVEALLKAAAEDRLEALYYVAVFTGLRQGEIFALRWSDLDLKAGSIHVQHTLEECRTAGEAAGTKLTLKEPKSGAGKRYVDLPQLAVDALIRHKARQLADGLIGEKVFTDTDGGWLRKSNFTRSSWKPLLKRAGLPDVRFHDLRHTHAALQLKCGMHMKALQLQLGHGQFTCTSDTYAHFDRKPTGKDDAKKMDALFPSLLKIADGGDRGGPAANGSKTAAS
jgi:integrase